MTTQLLPLLLRGSVYGVCTCRQRISLYAHITGLSFDYHTLDKPVTQATIADKADSEIRSVAIDHSGSAYETANMLWDNMDTPHLH